LFKDLLLLLFMKRAQRSDRRCENTRLLVVLVDVAAVTQYDAYAFSAVCHNGTASILVT
jgi:hypothetical protein